MSENMNRNFRALLEANWEQQKFLCVGLDPDLDKIPADMRTLGVREGLLSFNRAVVDATHDVVCSYKPNSAFYEVHGAIGWSVLQETIAYVNERAPHVPVILDAKRADIGNTNNGYAAAAFDVLAVDALTVHPYMGGESLKEFFDRTDKGIFVMCRNSNPGAGEFQDLDVGGEPLYLYLARAFQEKWNGNGNCGLVVGATYPEEIKRVRSIVPSMPLLVPGTGAQGGDLALSVAHAKDARGGGFIISTSRAIIFASQANDFETSIRAKTLEFHDAIVKAL